MKKIISISTLSGALGLLFMFLLQSCQPEMINGPAITVSRDTVWFDTVFTNMGSMTKKFLIRNNSNETVNLDKVYIPSGNNSNYRFNVNGFVGPSVEDIELEAHDSMYVFVEVTIDPNGGNTPMIVEDSLVVEYNNHTNYTRAIFVAFGQDAIYYLPTDTTNYGLPYSSLSCDVTWGPAKPIVVVGYLQDTCGTLTILPGTQVHFYKNSALFIDDFGILKVLGDASNPVVFQGTRLGSAYKDVPGQWDRIYINEGSTEHVIRNAVIKNAFIGLQLDDGIALTSGNLSTPKKVVLENVKIENMSAVGILSRHYNLDAYNVLINNCGQYAAALTYGGNIRMYHCTFANYWSGSIRNFPSLFFNNYYIDVFQTPNVLRDAPLNMEFNNGIVYGNVLAEVGYDSVNTSAFNYVFRNSVLKLDLQNTATPPLHFINVKANQDPKFTDNFNRIYTLGTGSSAINWGDPAVVGANSDKLMFDLGGSNRLVSGNPDAGAFEK